MSDFKPRRPQRQLKVITAPTQSAPTPVQSAPIVPVEAAPHSSAPEIIEPAGPVAAEPLAAEPLAPEPAVAVAHTVAAELPPPDASPAPVTAPRVGDGWTRLAEVQETLARGMGEIVAEITGIATSGTEATTEATVAMLGARNVAAVFGIQADLTCRNLATTIEGTAKLSATCVKTATEASRLFVPPFGAMWNTRNGG